MAKGFAGKGSIVVCQPINLPYLDDARKKLTLELALHNVPTVVEYAIKPIDLFLAQKVFRINLPFYCIVNIIASKAVFPELFGPNLTLESLIGAAKPLLSNKTARAACQAGCAEVRNLLGPENASQTAASRVLSLVSTPAPSQK